jgi:regulatory protein
MLNPPTLSLKGRALRALASRERSRVELERKLKQFEEEPGQLVKVLDDLTAKGFLDDQRAADAFAHRRGQKLGAARVVAEMKARGIESDAIANTAAELRNTELARAREVWRRKFGAPALEASERGKQMRFLLSRGFSAEIIRRVVASTDDAFEDDSLLF